MRNKTPFISLYAVVNLILLIGSITYADNIYVSCHEGKIYKLDSNGNETYFGAGKYGIAFNNGYLYAVYATEVYRYDSSGNRTICAHAAFPEAIAFDSSGHFYTNEWNNDDQQSIIKFDSGGIRNIFIPNVGDTVYGLACDKNNNLYASCEYSGNIMKYDSGGAGSVFASGFTSYGLTFDSSGNLYASNWAAGTIEKFDSSGNKSTFASGLNVGLFGIAFDSKGYLYAVNQLDGTIEKFDSSGNGVIFASGLSNPRFIAIDVPEPTSLLLLGLCGIFLRRK